MSEPIIFVDEDESPEPSAPPGTEPRPPAGDEAAPRAEPGGAEALALLAQHRQLVSQLVQACAFASQKLAEAGFALGPSIESGSITQKRLVEMKEGLERMWRLGVSIEASVKEE